MTYIKSLRIIQWKKQIDSRIRSERQPEELWTGVCNIVQKVVIKTIPKKKKCRKAKWLPEEGLQIAKKRRPSKNQRRKRNIYPSECRVPKNIKEK